MRILFGTLHDSDKSGTQSPVSLRGFRSNSKFHQNLESSHLKSTQLITAKFCIRHGNVTVVIRVQNCIGICRICYAQEHYKVELSFEFDRDIVIGTGVMSYSGPLFTKL